jgi:hypothetical protein
MLTALLGGGQPGGMGQQAPQQSLPRNTMMPGDYETPSGPPMQAPPQQPQRAPQNVAQMLLQAGFIKEAEEYAKAQGAIHGEAYGGLAVTQGGKPYYMTKQGPRYVEDGAFVPREELHFADTGDRVGVGLDKFTGKPVSGGVAKAMSPAEADAARRGWATFNRGELRDAPVDGGGTQLGWVTPQGFSAVPGTATKPKDVPASIQQALATNAVTLTKIDRALELVDQQPGAFGWKNIAGDWVRQQTNPEGVDARALVADIGSQKLHDRSGAAVTLSEAPRLTPFVPNVTDKPDTIKKKLTNFQREYAQMMEELQKGYGINHVAGMTNKNVGTVRMGDVQGDPLAEARKRGLIK